MSRSERAKIIEVINDKLNAATSEQLRSIFNFITHLIRNERPPQGSLRRF